MPSWRGPFSRAEAESNLEGARSCAGEEGRAALGSAPGLGKAAAQDVAGEGHPLLDEEARQEIEEAPKGFRRRRLSLVAAPLGHDGHQHSSQAHRGKLPGKEGREKDEDSHQKEERVGGEMQGQVGVGAVAKGVDGPLPGEKPKLVSVVHVHGPTLNAFPSALQREGGLLSPSLAANLYFPPTIEDGAFTEVRKTLFLEKRWRLAMMGFAPTRSS